MQLIVGGKWKAFCTQDHNGVRDSSGWCLLPSGKIKEGSIVQLALSGGGAFHSSAFISSREGLKIRWASTGVFFPPHKGSVKGNTSIIYCKDCDWIPAMPRDSVRNGGFAIEWMNQDTVMITEFTPSDEEEDYFYVDGDVKFLEEWKELNAREADVLMKGYLMGIGHADSRLRHCGHNFIRRD